MKNDERRLTKRQAEALLGRRIQALRQARGWSQEKVAQLMTAAGYQMHQSTVANIERGRRPTAYAEMLGFAQVLGFSPQVLMVTGDDDPSFEESLIAVGEYSRTASEVDRLRSELRDAEQRLGKARDRVQASGIEFIDIEGNDDGLG